MKQKNYHGSFFLWYLDQPIEVKQKVIDKMDQFLKEHGYDPTKNKHNW